MSYLFFDLEPSVIFCTGMLISIVAFFVYYGERVIPHAPIWVQRYFGFVGALDGGCLAVHGGIGGKSDSFGDIAGVGVGGGGLKGGGVGGGGGPNGCGGRPHPSDDL